MSDGSPIHRCMTKLILNSFCPNSFAGSDSTASTMQSFFYHILSNPTIYAKLTTEIDEAHHSGRLSRVVSWSEAQQLSFFQAALKEAMRMRPAVGLNITRLVPPGGADIDGRHFPGSTRVAVNGWVLHRDRRIFGEDVEVFRPERWLENEEKAKVMDRHMYQVSHIALCLSRDPPAPIPMMFSCSEKVLLGSVLWLTIPWLHSSGAEVTCVSERIWRYWR